MRAGCKWCHEKNCKKISESNYIQFGGISIMNELFQTDKYSIVYGDFHGKPGQELFRCPRELDDVDLRKYVNENRCLLGFEADTDGSLQKESDSYLGYYRMYFRDGTWHGRWMEESKKLDEIACHGVDEIISWLKRMFPYGCDWVMETYMQRYPNWGANRCLLKPVFSDHYKVLFDTTYKNEDYPVRIYVYE